MKKSLDEVRAEFEAVNTGVQKVCEGLVEAQLSQRPAPNRWSMAEILVHLNLTTQSYLPMVDKAIAGSDRSGARGPFELGRMGSFYAWYMEPPAKFRVPAPRMVRPLLQGPAGDALPQFLRSQAVLLQRLESAEGLDCSKVKLTSPFSSLLRMNLISFFAVTAAHQRRHLAQAEGVRAAIALGAKAQSI